ncbi:unnamed protein product [Paramecium octaurelia]|uniref:Uncharacterized protein n=1 Tax=Paramecium octaurelia TaxID=43137 RepID=A0A8S1U0T2_PAROT|nr:unnamed protein product [Paramecium octaurelia]
MKIQTPSFYLPLVFCFTYCYQFNEDLLISNSNPVEMKYIPQIQNSLQFEFWSFCIANWQVISYPWVEQEPNKMKTKQQLLFYMKTLNDNRVLAFLYTNVITNTEVTHHLFVDEKMNQIYYNPSEYEGIWILNVITFKGSKLCFETLGTTQNYNIFEFEIKKQIRDLALYVGGSGIINGVYELAIFRGRLSKIFMNELVRSIYQIFSQRISFLRQNEYEYTINLLPDLFNFDGIVQKEFEFEQFGRRFSIFGWVKYYTQDAYQLKKYLLVRLTLFKNYQDEIELGDELLKVTVDIDQSDSQNSGYDVLAHHYWMPYPSPLDQNPKNDKISLRGDLQYLDLLQKWHFVSFEYGLNSYDQRSQFKLNYFEDVDLVSKTYYLGNQQYNNLFINTKYYAIFGGDYTIYEKMKGQISGFYFKSNYYFDLNIEFNCHYSCQTCDGPLNSNCLSCYDNNERVFLEEFHKCVCPFGQFERNKVCLSYADFYPTLNYMEIKIELPISQCMFGYFYLPENQQCIKCPQSSSYNVLCVDCLLNPADWYIRPICTTDFVTQQVNKDQDAYTKQLRPALDYDLYYIDNNFKLILLEGVNDFCDIKKVLTTNCFELNVKHLSSMTFGICKQNRYYSNLSCNLLDYACIKLTQSEKKCQECISGYYISEDGYSCLQCSQSCKSCDGITQCTSCELNFGLVNGQCQRCGKFCSSCKYSNELKILRCLFCIDTHLYYLSLNAEDCKINEIENCKYAFEISDSNPSINSLDHDFIKYEEQTLTKCAKCEDGYYFDDSLLLCIKDQLENCQQFFKRMQGIQEYSICLFGPYNPDNLIYSFIDQCPKFKLHCLYCVIEQLTIHLVGEVQAPKKASYKCLSCENGFYASKRTGECQSCPSELHCLSCYQQNKFTKDNWKNEIQAFYRVTIDLLNANHKFTDYGLSQNDQDYEILCNKCEQGYEFYGENCIQICPESCLECVIINNTNICVKCRQGLVGRNRSLIDNKCVSCPQNCQLCKERDEQQVHQINPLFNNQQYSYFSYFCLSGFTGIFDQELGTYVDCQDGPCLKQIIINLNLYCNLDEYEQQLNLLYSDQEKLKFRQDNILSDDLFSNSSFKYFETQEFYQMANEKSIKQILIKIVSQQKQICMVTDQLQISQNFSSNIFSAIDVELEIYGNEITTLKFKKQLLLVNFKKVHIEGIRIEIEYFTFGPNLLHFTSLFEQTIELVNINYKQDFDLTTFYTIISNATNILIQDFDVKDCTRGFSIRSLIRIEQTQSQQSIKIINFSLINSSFENLHLFWFDLKEDDLVEINNVIIQNVVFNSALVYQTKGELLVNQIQISSCRISSQSGLFQISSLRNFRLNQFDFISNEIISGKIFNLNQYVSLMNLNFIKNELLESTLLFYNEKVHIEFIFIQNAIFQLNKHSESAKFMKIIQITQPNQKIMMNSISILENQLFENKHQTTDNLLDITLMYLEAQSVKIDKLTFEKLYGIPDLVIVNANVFQLNEISIQQHDNHNFKGLYQNFDCFLQSIENRFFYAWIKIYDVPIIDITHLRISKAQSINYPIIEIKTSILTFQTLKQIKFSELHLIQNLLLITNKINIASIIKISSEEDYQIDVINSTFEKNLMHQYIYIDQINSCLILFVDCKSCTFHLNNLIIKNNMITNSSNSIFYFQSRSIEIHNCSFVENNLFDYSILQPYLYWGFRIDQKIFMEEVIDTFPIKVKTGNAKIICQQILIRNFTIFNSTVSGLYLQLEKESSVQIQDAVVSLISPSIYQVDENGGAFFIDTSFSVSQVISFINIFASKISCRNHGGLLYIQNVLEATKISFSNIVINDVYSLKGSMLYVEFSLLAKQQQVILENLTLTNSNTFNEANSQLQQALKFGRSLFQINNANLVILKNIMIFSLFHESFAFLSKTLIIELINCRISNSIIQNSLVSVNSTQSNSSIRIVECHFTNISALDHIPITERCNRQSQNVEIQQYVCSNDSVLQESPLWLMQKQNKDNLLNSYCIINQINLYQQPIQSLIDIEPYFTFIEISELNLKSIKCDICQNGLLNINIQENETIIIMNSISIYDNQCGELGCFNIKKSIEKHRILQSLIQNINEKQYDLRVQNYKCIQNFAQSGTCLQIQDVKTLIKDSIFSNNIAKSQGGSIYVIGNEAFFILNSVISFNKAKFGGGLFLKDQIVQNLIKQRTIIYGNIGVQYGNDFGQLPSQLQISIDLDSFLPKVKIVENENILIEQIKIGSYKLFLQTYSDSLYVPNGQALSKYQFFNWKKQEYMQYNFHLRLIPMDLFNNVQENLVNTQCEISGRILKEKDDSNFTSDFTSFSQVTFNQSDYNFDNIAFYLDDQQNLTLQLQFHCNSIFAPIYGKNQEIIGFHNNYYIRMNIQSLPCQLGEIKSVFDGTCIPCNASQGLYSLVLNSNNCSQKDDFSTSEINSAQLKLKPGFWRPYFDTDQINQCINLLDNCNGGWIEGDTSCYEGHIGALCEECDIENIRGFGYFSTNKKYSCGSCIDDNQNIAAITAISLWTLISILISVRSNVSLNEQMVLKKVIQKLIRSNMQYHSNFGILIKMTTNHLQIVSVIFTFRFQTFIDIDNIVTAISNPIQSMTHSLDCLLKDMFDVQIHYSRIIWQIIMPFIYIFVFLVLYWFALKINKLKYNLNVITTTLIYMYIYLQPFLVGRLISLISFRQISGFFWIQANVAYRYDTQLHYQWLFKFCLPILILISLILPTYFLISLYSNKSQLNEKRTRQKWGYLYNEYKIQAYYWEIIKIIVKQLLIIFLSYYDENIVKKGILLLSLVYLYWELSKRYQPYALFILNKLDAYSANVCGISIAVGIGIYIDQQNQSYQIQIPYFIILFALNLQYLIKILKEIILTFLEENFLFFDKIKEIIITAMPWITKYALLQKLLQNRNVQKQRIALRYLKIKKYLINQAQKSLAFKNNLYGVKIISNSVPKYSSV